MSHVAPESLQLANIVFYVCAGFLVFNLGLYLFLMRRNKHFLPKGGIQWFLTVSLGLVSVVLLLAGLLAVRTKMLMTADVPYFEGVLGAQAPRLTFLSLADGSERNLSELRGKPILLNFWATWCPPCRDEMPILQQLQEKYREQGLEILALSDEQKMEVEHFFAGLPPVLTVGLLPLNTALNPPFAEASESRPFSFFIDREGQIRDFLVGSASSEFIEDKIREILK